MPDRNKRLLTKATKIVQDRVGRLRKSLSQKKKSPASGYDVAAELKISSDAVYSWIREENPRLPDMKIFEKIREALSFTPEEEQIVRRAILLRRSLACKGRDARVSLTEPKANALLALPAPKARPYTDNAKMAELEMEVQSLKLLMQRTLGLSVNQMAGADNHWTVDGMPFFLTPENFVPLDGNKWTAANTEHVIRCAQQLRKYLITIAQLGDPEQEDQLREELKVRLKPELDELWMAFEMVNSRIPLQCAKTIAAQELRFRLG